VELDPDGDASYRSLGMESPYAPPNASDDEIDRMVRSKKLHGWAAVLCGLGVVIPPMIGIAGTVIGMVGAFASLHRTGSADPSELAADISVTLLTTLWGLVFSVVMLIPFSIFLRLFLKQRKRLRAMKSGRTGVPALR